MQHVIVLQYFAFVLLFADCQLNTSKYQSLQAGREVGRGKDLKLEKRRRQITYLEFVHMCKGGRIQYEDKFVPPQLTRHCVNITQEVFELARALLRNKRFVLNEMFLQMPYFMNKKTNVFFFISCSLNFFLMNVLFYVDIEQGIHRGEK